MCVDHCVQGLACAKCLVNMSSSLFNDRSQFRGQWSTKNRKTDIYLSLFSLFHCFFPPESKGWVFQSTSQASTWETSVSVTFPQLRGKGLCSCVWFLSLAVGQSVICLLVWGFSSFGSTVATSQLLPQAGMKMKPAESTSTGLVPPLPHF